MFTEIRTILVEESKLIAEAAATEKQKRSAILSASGKTLQMLTEQSEKLIYRLRELEEKRNHCMEALSEKRIDGAQYQSLSRIPALFDEYAPEQAEAVAKIVETLRNAAIELKHETEENDRLLNHASQTIHRLLSSLSEKDRIYHKSPDEKKSNSSEGFLFNSNA